MLKSFTILKNPKTLKNCTKSVCALNQWNNKARTTAPVFTTWFANYFKPTAEISYSEENIPLKYDGSLAMQRVTQELWGGWTVSAAVVMPADTASILQPTDQGVVFIFKAYYSRNWFCKAAAAVDSDSSDGSGQSKWKTFSESPFKTHIKNSCNSWEKVRISTLTRV